MDFENISATVISVSDQLLCLVTVCQHFIAPAMYGKEQLLSATLTK